MTTHQTSVLDELEDQHVAILEQLLTKKLEAIKALPYGLGSAGEWELIQLLRDLGLIADELARMGTTRERESIPF